MPEYLSEIPVAGFGECVATALAMSDCGLALELRRTRMHDGAATILNDRRVGRPLLGGQMEEAGT